MKTNYLFVLVFILAVGVVSAGSFSVTQTGSFSTSQSSPSSFQSYYSSSDVSSYWPILADKDSCQGRQDLLLQISPAGCQPAVVRSDLLAEQNVPVFCQIDSLKINPLIDIKSLSNIRFSGSYPKEVAGTGFHPSRAALNTYDKLLGSPLINNVGYVVVILKKTEKESDLPDSVNVTLNAQIQYNVENAFGVGSAEFVLEPQEDSEWETDKLRQSFWQGRYSIRLERADDNGAVVSIYSGDQKLTTTSVKKGETSADIYLPGSYCSVALNVQFVGFEQAKTKATIEVSTDSGVDRFEVYEGSNFLNNKCRVSKITSTGYNSGNVSINCAGKSFVLGLDSVVPEKFGVFRDESGKFHEPVDDGGKLTIDFEGKIGKYVFDKSKGELSGSGSVDKNNKLFTSSEAKTVWEEKLRAAFIEYQRMKEGSNEGLDNSEKSSLFVDKVYAEDVESKFSEAVEDLKKVAKDFPAEKSKNFEMIEPFGQTALMQAITLARVAGKVSVEANLIDEFISTYPNAVQTAGFVYRLQTLSTVDSSRGGYSIQIDGSYKFINLIEVSTPKDLPSADFSFDGKPVKMNLYDKNEEFGAFDGGVKKYVKLVSVDTQKVVLQTNCDSSGNKQTGATTYTLSIAKGKDGVDARKTICGKLINLQDIEIKQVAKIRVSPKVNNAETGTNLTVNIGIEKRAIQLSPEKTEQMIGNLNDTIKKWEGISKNLGNAITGLKGACFATAGVLTVKNFMSGLGGETLARQQVMQGASGWTAQCKQAIAEGRAVQGDSSKDPYASMDDCFRRNADRINSDVSAKTGVINKVNSVVGSVESPNVEGSGFLGEKSLTNVDATKRELAVKIKAEHGSEKIDLQSTGKQINGNSEVTVNDVLAEDNLNSASYGEMVAMYNNLESRKAGMSEFSMQNSERSLADSAIRINDKARDDANYLKNSKASESGLPGAIYAGTSANNRRIAQVVDIESVKNSNLKGKLNSGSEGVSYVGRVYLGCSGRDCDVDSGLYAVGLRSVTGGKDLQVVSAVPINDDGSPKGESVEASKFISASGVSVVTPADSTSYHHKFLKPEVKYFETEPYKGMPALVPFDLENGWYAATKQTLPAMGNIGAYKSSGQVSSFMVCNVGANGRAEADEGMGDDTCELINTDTGQSYSAFPGLDESESKRLVQDAMNALQQAAQQYSSGGNLVVINGQKVPVGKPAVNVPSAQCQDFMNPNDCYLMFNVCDPVICPSSRCNFGGLYQVQDVVQTGIVGGIMLCLPNVKEGIVVPVCLTGIQAGIDSYISVLKAHRDCLQENLNSGKMIGFCDQVYSIYMCEFFWRQVAPVANILLPKLVEAAYGGGQGVRGGGEYMTVMGAWQNMKNSVDYFTQSYAVNSMKVFQSNSFEEAGSEICKSFISAKAPSSFKSLLEPESPPQFYASFNSIKYSDATVPATAQYKVYYHIFAGNNAGVYYSIYMKSPPETSYYQSTPTIQVDSGFVAQGQYESQTKDFTAPEGYKELCVRINDEEKCGFKEVTTDFALDYINNQYVANEIKDQNIKSESECISGSPSASGLATSINLQQGVEQSINPQIYNEGVIRICSTNNPGSSTNPARYMDVGYCGNEKLRCWLDKNSINNAISASDVGTKNATSIALENSVKSTLQSGGQILSDAESAEEINSLGMERDRIVGLKKIDEISKANSAFISRIELIYPKIYRNDYKANLLLMKGQVKAKLVKVLIGVDDTKSATGVTKDNKDLGQNMDPDSEQLDVGSTNSAEAEGKSQASESREEYYLNESYMPSKKISLMYNGEDTGVYTLNGDVKITKVGLFGINLLAGDIQVGTTVKEIDGWKIKLLPGMKDKIDSAVSSGTFDKLNGAIIDGDNIILNDVSDNYDNLFKKGNVIIDSSGDSAGNAGQVSYTFDGETYWGLDDGSKRLYRTEFLISRLVSTSGNVFKFYNSVSESTYFSFNDSSQLIEYLKSRADKG